MHQFPHHEWFWWLDLVRSPLIFKLTVKYTFIMEPSRSLSSQIFSRLDQIAVRNISLTRNPLGMNGVPHVDFSQPIDLIISQDCGGFSLGSFLLRRSDFARRLLDMWWDPILYEQKYAEIWGCELIKGIWNGITRSKMHLYFLSMCLLTHLGAYVFQSSIYTQPCWIYPSAVN